MPLKHTIETGVVVRLLKKESLTAGEIIVKLGVLPGRWRELDSALQKLRRTGLIKFDRVTKKWVAT